MTDRRGKVVIHNRGVIAGVIHGNVSVGSLGPQASNPGERGQARTPDPIGAAELLASLFDADGLRRFLRTSRNYEPVAHQLPQPPASTAMVMDEAANILKRHGLLDRSLAAKLIELFPGREADIRRSAIDW